MKKRFKITIAYDGTHYYGWQRQLRARTIQHALETFFSNYTGEKIIITGAGRTDAGVHAVGQVAHFDTYSNITLKELDKKLLPDICILSIEEVKTNFHARYCALAKIYSYHIQLRHKSPFFQKYRHFLPSLSLDAVRLKGAQLEGKHDFSSFGNNSGKKVNSIKTIYKIRLIATSYGVCLLFLGNSFLYKMVRNMVGTLIDDKMCTEKIRQALQAKNRSASSPAAPAKGLFLTEVIYSQDRLEECLKSFRNDKPGDLLQYAIGDNY